MTEFEKIATDCRAAAEYYKEWPTNLGPGTLSDIYQKIEKLANAADRAHRSAVVHVDND